MVEAAKGQITMPYLQKSEIYAADYLTITLEVLNEEIKTIEEWSQYNHNKFNKEILAMRTAYNQIVEKSRIVKGK